MQGRHTFSVDRVLRKCKHNPSTGYAYARITIDAEQVEVSTKEQVNILSWNSRSEKVSGRTIEVRTLNEHLDNIRFTIKKKYREMVDDNTIALISLGRSLYLTSRTPNASRICALDN